MPRTGCILTFLVLAVCQAHDAVGQASTKSSTSPAIFLDFRDAVRLYERDTHGRRPLRPDETIVFDPRNEIQVVFVRSAFEKYVRQYASLEGLDVASEDIERRAAQDLSVYVRNLGEERNGEPLIAEYEPYDDDEVILARFRPEDYFADKHQLTDSTPIYIHVNFRNDETREVPSIPFRAALHPSRALFSQVSIRFSEREPERSIAYVRPVSFVDVNESLIFRIRSGIEVIKEVEIAPGSWAKLDPPIATRDDHGLAIVDTDLVAGKTYRYHFVRPYEDGKHVDDLPSRTFIVDDYGTFVFVPTAEVQLSKKILLPLVVPIRNKPETSGSSLQFGPGLALPLLHINPAPKGSAITGVRNLRPKLGIIVAALRAAGSDDEEEADEFGAFGGGWISFLDAVQVGVSWRIGDRVSGKPMTYLGFSLVDLAELLNR